MNELILDGCGTRPLGAYLKALGVLRLLSEQADPKARGWWYEDRFHLRTKLSRDELIIFFLDRYAPTPILAPWNGGSGFYPNDRKVGIDALASSSDPRFASYRGAIAALRSLPEIVQVQKAKAGRKNNDENAQAKVSPAEEDERRTSILRHARNLLPDSAVEWLDASVGIDSEGKRAFAPVLGTGGNEGRLDYTNNFMERIAALLVMPGPDGPQLLENALFATACGCLQPAAVGQFDPGRAGGFNQSQGIESPDVPVNPWNFILTLEGAVAWASGIYRRQGVTYRSLLCSPFTVTASKVGYGSASANDDARAELWTPVWQRPAAYAELKVLLREGRAAIGRTPARTGLQFAEAASSLGVDRGIHSFVRYSLLKRRGDSYVALPAGIFSVEHRSIADRIRELDPILERFSSSKLPAAAAGLRRSLESAIYEALLREGSYYLRSVMVALGRLIRWAAQSDLAGYLSAPLDPVCWVEACGSSEPEVRIAAALSSFEWPWPIRHSLFSGAPEFAWTGLGLADRLIAVLERRIRIAPSPQSKNALAAACELHPGDATLFVENSVDDDLIENLLFAFTCLNWKASRLKSLRSEAEVLPVYVALKYLFLPSPVLVAGEPKRLPPDSRILSLLRAGNIHAASEIALNRLRVSGLEPIIATYGGEIDTRRLAASLLLPVRRAGFESAILHKKKPDTLYV